MPTEQLSEMLVNPIAGPSKVALANQRSRGRTFCLARPERESKRGYGFICGTHERGELGPCAPKIGSADRANRITYTMALHSGKKSVSPLGFWNRFCQ